MTTIPASIDRQVSSNIELLDELLLGDLEVVKRDVSGLETFVQDGKFGEDSTLVALRYERLDWLGRIRGATLDAFRLLGG